MKINTNSRIRARNCRKTWDNMLLNDQWVIAEQQGIV
jgi:hypothetical protein